MPTSPEHGGSGRRLGPIEIVRCHAEGEVGDVIVSGVPAPPGASVWDQSRWIAADGALRRTVLNEPRGGVFRHVNLIVPAVDPRAAFGFIIMEPEHTPPMSGSNSICVATVALETGLVPMTEPTTTLVMEAPGGVVEVVARCRDGKVLDVTVTNVACFAGVLDADIDVPGLGRLRVDTAFGGDSFVLVDAADVGLSIVPENAAALAEVGRRITAAASEQLGFDHPTLDWHHISFCQIAEPARQVGERRWRMRSTTAIDPGKLDRSPTGTGVSARLAAMHARGLVTAGDELEMRSIIDSVFLGRIADVVPLHASGGGDTDSLQIDDEEKGDGRMAIVPTITGRAWRTGTSVLTTDPTDPWPEGYRLSDTWPLMER